MNAVTADNMSKVFPSGTKAVDDISFALGEGEVFGFLGPNGSGKTTTVKLLNGMLSPTSGSCRIFGVDPHIDPVSAHQASGVLTELAQMYGGLTGLQNLIFYGSLYGVNAHDAETRALGLLRALGLEGAKNQKLDTYSTGMRQRLSLARALIHKPRILFLDEPTSGLDPESIVSVNNMIKGLADEGATVFLCTHQLRYAQEICTSYGLIDNGSILALGDLNRLRSLVARSFTVTIKSDKPPKSVEYRKAGGSYEINVKTEAEIPAIVKSIVDANGKVYSVTSQNMALEEIYFALLEQRHKGEGGPGK